MLNQVRPTTLSGIKNLALKIKRADGLGHARALDQASRQGGFENWPHALGQLKNGVVRPSASRPAETDAGAVTWVTAYWRDRDTGASGREVLSVRLSRPLTDLVTPTQLAAGKYIGGMRIEAADHLREHQRAQSQSYARWIVKLAARTLQFMDATGLKPSKGHSRVYPHGRYENAVPGHDHGTVWYDPDARRYIYLDEPYEGRAESRAEERCEWSARFGQTIVKPAWRGMYNPDGRTEAYIVADTRDGYDLGRLLDAVDAIEPLPSEWTGQSLPLNQAFQTPAEAVSEATPAPVRKPRSPNVTVAYRALGGERRRPKATMPVKAHQRIGALMVQVMAEVGGYQTVETALATIRGDLDDWVQREHPDEADLPNDLFRVLYYNDTVPRRRGHAAVHEVNVLRMEQVKAMLVSHYPDCAPLRRLLHRADRVIGFLRRAV